MRLFERVCLAISLVYDLTNLFYPIHHLVSPYLLPTILALACLEFYLEGIRV